MDIGQCGLSQSHGGLAAESISLAEFERTSAKGTRAGVSVNRTISRTTLPRQAVRVAAHFRTSNADVRAWIYARRISVESPRSRGRWHLPLMTATCSCRASIKSRTTRLRCNELGCGDLRAHRGILIFHAKDLDSMVSGICRSRCRCESEQTPSSRRSLEQPEQVPSERHDGCELFVRGR